MGRKGKGKGKGKPPVETEFLPGCCFDGRDLSRLSQCSTKHWRIAGDMSLHGVRVTIGEVEYTFKATEWEDREFEVDKKAKARTKARNIRKRRQEARSKSSSESKDGAQ